MNKIIDQTFKVAIYLRLSKEDDDLSCSSGAKSESNSISNQDVICRGWFLPPNTIT